MDNPLAKFVCERLKHLKGERSTWEDHWQQVADYVLPDKNNINTEYTPGQKRNTHLYDNTAIDACELLAGSLQGILTNPNSTWFELTTGDIELDRNDNVRAWLQDSVSRMHRVMNNSNFQTEVHEFYIDLCAFGTASMTVEQDDQFIVHFMAKPVQENFISENKRGVIDEIYREFKWTSKKILQEWDKSKIPEEFLRQLTKDPQRKFTIIHAIAPREVLENSGVSLEEVRKKYVSAYILQEKKITLELGGFNEFPYIVSRWGKTTGEVYGRSPGMTALPDAKTLNKIVETQLIAAEKALDPPLQLPDDGFIMPIITKPGSLNFYRAGSGDRIEPVFNQPRIDIGIEMIREHRRKIKEAFKVDLFQLREGPQKTATEVLQLTEEQGRILGPLLGRQQHEFLRPLIERVFSIMNRRDQFEDPPEELDGVKLDVRYSSLVARSHKANEGQNIMRTIELMAPFLQMDQTVVDNFNGDRALRKVAEIFNFPQEIIRPQEEVEETREARAQAQQEMIQQQEAQAQADVAQKVAPLAAVASQNG